MATNDKVTQVTSPRNATNIYDKSQKQLVLTHKRLDSDDTFGQYNFDFEKHDTRMIKKLNFETPNNKTNSKGSHDRRLNSYQMLYNK